MSNPKPVHKFKKGNQGKPKGAVSEKTKMWEQLGEFIVNEGAERAMKYLKTLDDEAFFSRFTTMLDYFKPKQQRTYTEVSGELVQTTRQQDVFEQLLDDINNTDKTDDSTATIETQPGETQQDQETN